MMASILPAIRRCLVERAVQTVVQDVLMPWVAFDVDGHHILRQGRGNLVDRALEGITPQGTRVEEYDDEGR